jgi:hypothetical protein
MLNAEENSYLRQLHEAHKARRSRLGMVGNQAARDFAKAERERERKEAEEARIKRELAEYSLNRESIVRQGNEARRRKAMWNQRVLAALA